MPHLYDLTGLEKANGFGEKILGNLKVEKKKILVWEHSQWHFEILLFRKTGLTL